MTREGQIELLPSTVTRLDESDGVVVAPESVIEKIGPEDRVTLGRFAFELGQDIDQRPRQDAYTDSALEVYRKDFYNAEPEAIEKGLYIPPGSPRYTTAEQLVTVGNEPCELELPGVVDRRTGVVFPREEFHVVARSARDLSKHVKAQTRRANGSEPDRDAVELKAYRSAGHAMDQKVQSLSKLESELIDERHLLVKIFQDAKSTWRSHYKTKNLDKDRKTADELIHNTAETATINLNLGTTTIKALHRVITSNLYRRGSARELTTMWQVYTSMAGRYANARRGKVMQSRQACLKQLNIYGPYLEMEAD